MKELNKLIQEQFNKMCSTGKLFRSSVSGQTVWDTYLSSFEQDTIFRDPSSSTHNCNTCNNFVRRYGNIVAIIDNKIQSIWDVVIDGEFKPVVKNISTLLKSKPIQDIFVESYNTLNEKLNYEKCKKTNSVFRLGIDVNYKKYTGEEVSKFGVVNQHDIYTFNHLHLDVPKTYIDFSNSSVESIMANYRTDKEVLKRCFDTIPLEVLQQVKELSLQNSLLDATSHVHKIDAIIPLKAIYDSLSKSEKDNYSWLVSYKFQYAKFRNELIGVLCSEISEGFDLNLACSNWNKRVDPINYMKAVAPITQKQKQEAEKFVIENCYEKSFNRRLATINDIKASEILHINSTKSPKAVNIFSSIETKTPNIKLDKDKLETITITDFMKDVLPNTTSLEVLLENRMTGNLVNITTTVDTDSKPIFKWNNNYSWTFNGNLAGKSQIKDAIESRGGKTEGVLNVRLAFPNTESDYDLHITEPKGVEVYYGNRRQMQQSTGMLDLDAQGADGHFPPEKRVENIIYTNKSKMPIGNYKVYVNNYSKRDNNYGFDIEIEIEGNVTTFKYNELIEGGKNVNVCNIHFDGNNFEIKPTLPISDSNILSKELWGLQTNKFHKVNLMCLTPNHWDDNNVGNKYYLFMLEGCKNKDKVRGFHNENLITDLLSHRKVLDVLGNKCLIDPIDSQLAGVGFNSTVSDELIVKTNKRVYKLIFK